LDETDKLLREFYAPFNQILAKALKNESFLWTPDPTLSLREKLIFAEENKPAPPFGGMKANAHNPHSAHEHADRSHIHGHHDGGMKTALHGSHGDAATPPQPTNLRGVPDAAARRQNEHPGVPVKFSPRSFDISDLEGRYTNSTMIVQWLKTSGVVTPDRVPMDEDEAGEMLAHAIIALDLAALKYLLYDLGVPPNVKNRKDHGKNAFDTLACLGIIAEGHQKSIVYDFLKGRRSWLHDEFDPPLPLKQASVHSADIIESLDKRIRAIIAWLDRAGVSVSNIDPYESNILHFAVNSGIKPMVEHALKKGVDPNHGNYDDRTPLHLAAALGRAEILKILIDGGGDVNYKDEHGISTLDIISQPGPIQPDDAVHILGIPQRPPRKIDRFLHPEISSNSEKIDPSAVPGAEVDSNNPLKSWPSTGGWGLERLPGYETDMECAIDQYYAHEITAAEIFNKYIARNSPVLIRGLLHEWPAIQKWSKDVLKSEMGDLQVKVSDIPYAEKYGGSESQEMSLGEYIDQVREHRIIGGHYPWYVTPHGQLLMYL
jgi:hypothetical protein